MQVARDASKRVTGARKGVQEVERGAGGSKTGTGGPRPVPECRKGVLVDPGGSETGAGGWRRVARGRNGARWVKNTCQWLQTRGWVSKTGAGGSRRVAGARKEVLLHLNRACESQTGAGGGDSVWGVERGGGGSKCRLGFEIHG